MSGLVSTHLYFLERVRAGRTDRVRVFYDRVTALAALAHDKAET